MGKYSSICKHCSYHMLPQGRCKVVRIKVVFVVITVIIRFLNDQKREPMNLDCYRHVTLPIAPSHFSCLCSASRNHFYFSIIFAIFYPFYTLLDDANGFQIDYCYSNCFQMIV